MDRTERVRTGALVAAGGTVGSVVRWLVREALDGDQRWATITVNVAGCALLAVVTAPGRTQRVRFALGTGFCGGLTTFSTFALDVVELGDSDRSATAIGYVAASVVLGIAAFVLVRGRMLDRSTASS